VAGEAEQLDSLCDDDAMRGLADDGDDTTPPELEHPFISEHPQGPQDGVGMDTEYGRHVTRRREAAAGTDVPSADVVSDRGGNLLVQREISVPLDLDIQHGDMHSITRC
jgi:hypothetical protein